MVHVKKFLAALIIGAFTLGGIGCSGDKDKDKKDKDKDKDAKPADKDKDKKDAK
jgi:hypothetical protein